MNNKKYIAFPLLLSLLCINNVYADCTEEARNEFNSIKDQYKITNTYNSDTKTYTMRIETANTDKFRYVTSLKKAYECKKISDTITECYGYEPGISFYAYVISDANVCHVTLKKEEIHLDKLNKYYGDPLCLDIEEFVLCQEIYDREIDRETFEYRINKYKEKKELKKQEELKQQQEENEQENKISTYIKENITQVIIITIFIVLVLLSIIITIKSEKKSRRLE